MFFSWANLWVNYHHSLSWIKAIGWWFPWLANDFQWDRELIFGWTNWRRWFSGCFSHKTTFFLGFSHGFSTGFLGSSPPTKNIPWLLRWSAAVISGHGPCSICRRTIPRPRECHVWSNWGDRFLEGMRYFQKRGTTGDIKPNFLQNGWFRIEHRRESQTIINHRKITMFNRGCKL